MNSYSSSEYSVWYIFFGFFHHFKVVFLIIIRCLYLLSFDISLVLLTLISGCPSLKLINMY